MSTILPSEHFLTWLDGGKHPVRIGNGAWDQRQLDVYGELMGAVYLLREHLTGMDQITREFLVNIVEAAASRWGQKIKASGRCAASPGTFFTRS